MIPTPKRAAVFAGAVLTAAVLAASAAAGAASHGQLVRLVFNAHQSSN